MNLFIDTNILLSFYQFTSEDLDQLQKLAVLLGEKRVRLWAPDQIFDELSRNREKKIQESLRQLKEQKLALQFAHMCRHYAVYDTLRTLQKAYDEQHAILLGQLEEDVANEALKADLVIKELLDNSARIACGDDVIAAARNRVELGNPPGKPGSIGDAVNWEALLKACPRGEDLHFVTDDKDYASPLDEAKFSGYLASEWNVKKQADVRFHRKLSSFFKTSWPKIELAVELEKDSRIAELSNSANFSRTHRVVSALSEYPDFTDAQANDIVDAALSNNQVSWIIRDPDVSGLMRRVLAAHGPSLGDQKRAALEKALAGDG